MKVSLKNLAMIGVLSFTLSFVTGMSATIMYQEHMAAEVIADDLTAETYTANIDFS